MATTALPNRVTIRKVKPRPRSLESYAWFFMRLSGVALLLLAVGHMVMQHIQNDVHNASLQWVLQSRWSLAVDSRLGFLPCWAWRSSTG